MKIHPDFLGFTIKTLEDLDNRMSNIIFEDKLTELTYRSKLLIIRLKNFQIEVKSLKADIQNYNRRSK